MDFDRASIVSALTELGEALYRQRQVADVAVFGGAAMAFQFDVSFTTEDIDAVVRSGHGELTRAAQEIGRRRGWSSSWLNEA